MTRLLSPCLLVAGAHDPLGRRVVELLLRRDEAEVIATSRQPVHLVDLAARGARIRGADPDDAASLDAAFTGAHRLLLLPGAADGSWSRRRQLQAMIDAAARARMGEVVRKAVPFETVQNLRSSIGEAAQQAKLAEVNKARKTLDSEYTKAVKASDKDIAAAQKALTSAEAELLKLNPPPAPKAEPSPVGV